ncbi:MAG: hypothetical protein WCF24_12380 [Acidimicrobiales bacterium]
MTWKDIAQIYPEFVEWIEQRCGPLPDGNVKRADYEELVVRYEMERKTKSAMR